MALLGCCPEKRVKLQTSNFARGLRIRDTKPKIVKMGRGPGHVTYFSNFGTNISRTVEVTNLKFYMRLVRVHTDSHHIGHNKMFLCCFLRVINNSTPLYDDRHVVP